MTASEDFMVRRSDPGSLPPFSKDDRDLVNVIIETPKGSRNKFKYEEKSGLFSLSGVLPEGMSFPYDFGFVPGTKAPDGDPIDVLVLMDEPAFPGCLVQCRLLAVIEAKQTEDGKTERNDRLIAVAENSQEHSPLRNLKDLNAEQMRQLEEFFTSYNRVKGKAFKVLARRGRERALALLRRSVTK